MCVTRPAAPFLLPLTLALALAGCTDRGDVPRADGGAVPADDGPAAVHAGHGEFDPHAGHGEFDPHAGHGGFGPHGGHVVEFTADRAIRGEFVVETGNARFYLYGPDLETPLRAERVTFNLVDGETGRSKLIQMRQAGPVGRTAPGEPSEDQVAHEWSVSASDLPGDGIEELTGAFGVTIDGEKYEGPLTHDHADGAVPPADGVE